MHNFDDRTRFNWGFHDGTSGIHPLWAIKSDVQGHFDPVYEAGYHAGVASFKKHGVRLESSDDAWKEYNV